GPVEGAGAAGVGPPTAAEAVRAGGFEGRCGAATPPAPPGVAGATVGFGRVIGDGSTLVGAARGADGGRPEGGLAGAAAEGVGGRPAGGAPGVATGLPASGAG